MKIGFIGLGNVGSRLALTLQRNDYDLTVRELDQEIARPLLEAGAKWASSAKKLTEAVDMVITCLPSPQICSKVMEQADGVLAGLRPGTIWAEMSTTDSAEVMRLGAAVEDRGGEPIDCPVSGGCHRAATGNISIFAGCKRTTFECAFDVLSTMGRRILHTGPLGSASVLKVMTNYLATANLVTLCEALATAKKVGLDLNTTYEAIRISSGNSFVHETESQVILNGSRDINFTMDLVMKDISLFQQVAEQAAVPLEINPVLVRIFEDGIQRYGAREWSPNIIKRLEEACDISVLAPGFPDQIEDLEPKEAGYEIPGNTTQNA